MVNVLDHGYVKLSFVKTEVVKSGRGACGLAEHKDIQEVKAIDVQEFIMISRTTGGCIINAEVYCPLCKCYGEFQCTYKEPQ